MEAQHTAKQSQSNEISTLMVDSMNKHVYPQLDSLLRQSNMRIQNLEQALHGDNGSAADISAGSSDQNRYSILDDEMTDASSPASVSGQKHGGSPSRSHRTPPPKRTIRSSPLNAAATPGTPSSNIVPASQNISGFTEQSQLSSGSE